MNTIAEKHVGIVLKKDVQNVHKIALFDNQLGRIDALTFTRTVCLGAIIEYCVQSRTTMHVITDIYMLDVPLQLARKDLLFLHHVLEICAYFMPVGLNTAGIFDMIMFLYSIDSMHISSQFKKLFLVKLLAMLGAHPEHYVSCSARLTRLIAMSIDKISRESIDLECEKELEVWLQQSMAEYLNDEYFKTIHFLNQE